MVTVPEILTAVAIKIGTVPGVAASYYPKPAKLTRWPSVVLLWGGQNAGPTEVTSSVSNKGWMVPFTARLLVSTKSQPTREQARIDDLITPIADLFDTYGGGVKSVLPTIAGHIDTIEFVRVANELTTDYAGEECYVADLVFITRFKRRTGS